jgi:hypothetical protein
MKMIKMPSTTRRAQPRRKIIKQALPKEEG